MVELSREAARYWEELRRKKPLLFILPSKYDPEVYFRPWTPYFHSSNTITQTLARIIGLTSSSEKWRFLRISEAGELLVGNFPSEYPLPASQVADLKEVAASQSGSWQVGRTWNLSSSTDSVNVGNFPSEYPLPASQVSDLKTVSVDNFPSEYPLPASQVSDLKQVSVSDLTKVSTIKSVEATSAGTTAVWTPASGKKIRVKFLMVFNSGTDNNTVDLRFTTTGQANFKATLAANSGYTINLIGTNWEGGTDETLYINLGSDGTVNVTVMGEEV